jgi:hypothetical protein
VIWLIIAEIVAVWALVTVSTVMWFKWMDARHDRAFTELQERLNRGERSRGSRSAGAFSSPALPRRSRNPTAPGAQPPAGRAAPAHCPARSFGDGSAPVLSLIIHGGGSGASFLQDGPRSGPKTDGPIGDRSPGDLCDRAGPSSEVTCS